MIVYVKCPWDIMFTYHLCMTSSWVIPFHVSGLPSPRNRRRNGHQKQSPAERKLERRFWVDFLHDFHDVGLQWFCVGLFVFFILFFFCWVIPNSFGCRDLQKDSFEWIWISYNIVPVLREQRISSTLVHFECFLVCQNWQRLSKSDGGSGIPYYCLF